MQQLTYDKGIEWLEFELPTMSDDDVPVPTTVSWRVHVNFLMSNWRCVYGQGCPGLVKPNESNVFPDVGCCTDSFYFYDDEDEAFVAERAAELTTEDLDSKRLAYVKKNGFLRKIGDETKGKVWKGACVFYNPADSDNGKMGCAFHHLGQRTGRTDHTEVMPRVCWQLPFKYQWDEESEINVLYPWTSQEWCDPDEDGNFDHFACWWCVDSPEAYTGTDLVYVTMEAELRKMMTDEVYDKMKELLDDLLWRKDTTPKMPGQTTNEGRALLPLTIANRSVARGDDEEYKATAASLIKMTNGE